MFCRKCGKEVDDEAVVCIHCGRALKDDKPQSAEYEESKSWLGVILALFVGIIGLIIGICIYPAGTVARSTFVKAWCITFFTRIGIVILFWVIMFSTILKISIWGLIV